MMWWLVVREVVVNHRRYMGRQVGVGAGGCGTRRGFRMMMTTILMIVVVLYEMFEGRGGFAGSSRSWGCCGIWCPQCKIVSVRLKRALGRRRSQGRGTSTHTMLNDCNERSIFVSPPHIK